MPRFALPSLCSPSAQIRAVTRLIFCLCCVGSLLSLPSYIIAQTGTATLSGTITDQAGAIAPNVHVTITDEDTGVSAQTQTNSAGIYNVGGLIPGRYRVVIVKEGFKQVDVRDITLNVQDIVSRNFILQVGGTSETIQVNGSGENVNTTDASVSTVIDKNFVESLPLNGRSFNTLLQLTPGVVIAQQTSSAASITPGQFSISGQRTDGNNFTVDGVSADFGVAVHGLYTGESGTGSDQAFSALGGTSSLVSVEALQEFRIETSSFAPEFGKTPGGQVVLTTRSGTNKFHGELYEYFRNDVMDANDWFANQAGLPRAPERHNDFGGILGGPIRKDSTFFFFSYEGARLRLPETGISPVPYLNTTTCVAPAAVAPYLDAFPKPNSLESDSTCTGQFTGSFSNSATLDATSLRVDHNFGRFSVFARYNYAPSSTIATNPDYSLNMLEQTPVNTQTLTLGANFLFNKNMTNSFRANYSTQTGSLNEWITSYGGATPFNASLISGTLPQSDTLVTFQTFDTNYFGIGPISSDHTRQINLVDDINVSVGKHELKFGIDYRDIYLDKVPYSGGIGLTSDSVQDLISSSTVTEVEFITESPTFLATQSTSLYAQDTWKADRRVTMTYGLRWELAPAPSPRNGSKVASWVNVNNPSQIALAPFGTPIWQTTYGNVAPRIGVAWKPSGQNDLVVRGGVGLFYDLGNGDVADAGNFFPGSTYTYSYNVPLPFTATAADLPVISLQPPFGVINAFSPNLELPRSLEWNVAVEKEFKDHQVMTMTYVGQHGIDLLRRQALYQPNSNFKSAFLLTGNTSWSNYNALQVQYRAAISGRLQALLNYTYSHSLDNASDDVVSGLSNTVISAASDYASSSFDVRQSFSGALTFQVPAVTGAGLLLDQVTKGWSLASVAVARTGFPFNAELYNFSLNGGYAYTRPNLVAGQPFWIANPNAGGGKSLNPNAFVTPTTTSQGTESRNDIGGFGLKQVDLSLGRTFPLFESWNLKFQADAFNVANHPNFTNPLGLIGYGPTYLQSTEMLNQGLGGLNPLFQEGGPRSLQLSLKVSF